MITYCFPQDTICKDKQDITPPNIESNVPLQKSEEDYHDASDEEETDEGDSDDDWEKIENISLDNLNDDSDDDIENVAPNLQENKR